MRTLPISKVKERMKELVNAVSPTHDQVTITDNDSPAVVRIGANELDALEETLFWLSQDGNREAVAAAREEIAAGNGLTQEQIRAAFGEPDHRE